MNSKMTTNSQLSTTEPTKQKQKLSKQLEQEQNHRNGNHMEGYQQEKIQGIRSINGRYKIDGGVCGRNSRGNGEAIELICTIHGHELRWGRGMWWEGVCRVEGNKAGEMGQL